MRPAAPARAFALGGMLLATVLGPGCLILHQPTSASRPALRVLNPQSYPQVSRPWTVQFLTQGIADLRIEGLEHDEVRTDLDRDVAFLSLQCGDEHRHPERIANALVYASWSCPSAATLVLTVLQPGKHHLRFRFGRDSAHAYNDATGFTDPTHAFDGAFACDNPVTDMLTSNDQRTVCDDGSIAEVDIFGFSISNGNSIDGIEVRVEWHADATLGSPEMRLDCQLLDATGTPTGTTKSIQTTSTTEIVDIMGSSSDLWGTSFGESTIEDPDFGVRCTGVEIGGSGRITANIDNIDIQITHSSAAARRIFIVE